MWHIDTDLAKIRKKRRKKSNICVVTARTSRTLDKRNENQSSVLSQQISSQDSKLKSYMAYKARTTWT